MNIKDMDLNLLVALDKLIEWRSVSQAAKILGVTQPAMSNILSRLRRTFDDELLVKNGRDMGLTTRAEELALPLREILQSIQSQILDTKTFDPHVDDIHFKLGFHDYEQLVIHAKILPLLLKHYPKITMEHIPLKSVHPTEELSSGVIDFSTGPLIRDRSGILMKKLFMDHFVCLADRRNKKLKGKKIDLDTFAELEHIFIAPHGGLAGQADAILHKKGMRRFIRMSVTEFSITPWLILNTDLVVTLPYRAAKIFASQHRHIVVHECPIKIDPVIVYLSWHERLNNSEPHKWLKRTIIENQSGLL